MRPTGSWLAVALVAATGGITHFEANSPARYAQQIRTMYAALPVAFRHKDVDAIMSRYVPTGELFLFDLLPPREYIGYEAVKKNYLESFAAFPGPVDRFEIQELNVVADGTLAYSRYVEAMTLTARDGSKAHIALRITDALRRISGKWLIVQEHISVPVDLDHGGKPDLESAPSRGDQDSSS